MGKKKTSGDLGRKLIKDRFGKRANPKGDNFLHTSELNDGYDWGRLNLQSVTEQSNLDDFLTTAELAGTEFAAEKLNVKFVNPKQNSGLLSEDEKARVKKLQDQHRGLLRIPRRPPWSDTTSPDELDRNEKEAFLLWRRGLATIQELEGIVLTPYEKNLDFWRQLWRVIERSDVIVQVVDARNPLLFRCEDVERYVKEVDSSKQSLLLVNKADFLTTEQRQRWCQYFDNVGVQVVFWSALQETQRQAQEAKLQGEEGNDFSAMEEESEDDFSYEDEIDEDEKDEGDEKVDDKPCNEKQGNETESETEDKLKQMRVSESEYNRLNSGTGPIRGNSTQKMCVESSAAMSVIQREEESSSLSGVSQLKDEISDRTQAKLSRTDSGETSTRETAEDWTNFAAVDEKQFCDKYGASSDSSSSRMRADTDITDTASNSVAMVTTVTVKNSEQILSGPELISFLKSVHLGKKVQDGLTTVGMIGYPNVGKSSTINAILRMKKVPVSATPGRTKHFQTLFVDSDLMLCDCPGLVFPSFVSTKAELIVNGVLPIDQMRDHVPPVSLICHYIRRSVLETLYGINIPPPLEGEDPERDPTADELLNAYGHMRGFMTANGMPDCPRTARYILKDFVIGKLSYCNPPPGIDMEGFNSDAVPPVIENKGKQLRASHEKKPIRQNRIDRDFFKKAESNIHSKGVQDVSKFVRSQGLQQIGQMPGGTPCGSMQSLAEKPWKKHHNRHKKEKLRRVYKDSNDYDELY